MPQVCQANNVPEQLAARRIEHTLAASAAAAERLARGEAVVDNFWDCQSCAMLLMPYSPEAAHLLLCPLQGMRTCGVADTQPAWAALNRGRGERRSAFWL